MYIDHPSMTMHIASLMSSHLIISLQATAMKYSEPRQAKRKAEQAFQWNIFGITVGVIIDVTILIVYFTAVAHYA